MPSSRPHSSPSHASDSSPMATSDWSPECRAADDERLGEPRVVVCEAVLEPQPRTCCRLAVGGGELFDEPFEQHSRVVVETIGIEAREAENGVGGRPQRDVHAERRHECVEKRPRRARESRDPGGREDLTERPDRSADMVADMRLVQPASVVAHEVPHPGALGPGRELQEGERAMEDGCPLTIGRAAGELERDDREPRDVVDAVARLPARDHAGGVLNDPDVVDQRPQMVRSDRRELELDDRDRLSPRLGQQRPPAARPPSRRRSTARRARPRSAAPPRVLRPVIRGSR